MRRPSARAALVVGAASALALTLPASAATGPSTLVLTDPTGDAPPGLHGDITKLTYTTTGKTVTKKVGRKVTKVYTPRTLLITLTTADPIDTSGTTMYEIDSDLAGCEGGFNVWYTPGVDGSEGGGCANGSFPNGTTDGVDGPPTVAGSTLTFAIPFNALPTVFKAGAAISGIDAYTGAVEPVMGLVGPYLVDPALGNDELKTDTVYKIG
jgi:hypothetical protein